MPNVLYTQAVSLESREQSWGLVSPGRGDEGSEPQRPAWSRRTDILTEVRFARLSLVHPFGNVRHQ